VDFQLNVIIHTSSWWGYLCWRVFIFHFILTFIVAVVFIKFWEEKTCICFLRYVNYCEIFLSVHSLILIASSTLHPNTHYVFATYTFLTTTLLHVSVCYAPSSGRTSYICSQLFLTFCWPVILVINQLDAQNFCLPISLFHASPCFVHMCSTSGGQNCITQPLVSSNL